MPDLAQQADVPLVMTYLDQPRKRSGIGPVFQPTGDVEADMAAIKAWYGPFKGKNWRQHQSGAACCNAASAALLGVHHVRTGGHCLAVWTSAKTHTVSPSIS